MKQHNPKFVRLETLIGHDNLEKITSKNILVIGIGGVGGYVVESLIRSGISNITIVDYDVVDSSNINRQIIALDETIGLNKVDVFERRIRSINKDCIVKKLKLKLNNSNKDEILSNEYDYIIDCCDDVSAKKIIIKYCIDNNIKLISSMGTAKKMDPSKLEVTTLDKTFNDPLARIMRKYVKDLKTNKKIMVLSSREVPIKCENLGSNSFVPATAGLMISAYVINNIING